MKSKKFFLIVWFFLICILMYNCNNSSSPDYSLIYYNSFELPSDLNGWNRLDTTNLVDEASPNGGTKSVRISGGCNMPTSTYTLSPTGENNFILVQCYGKNLGWGGDIVLCLGEDYVNEPSILVKDTSWTLYKSENTFYWPAGSSLTICLNSGGYVASAMLIDELKIVKANYFRF